MAVSALKRLVNVGSFSILQDKLEKWVDVYQISSCDENVARACEIIELNARIQGQLFKIINNCAQEGGIYGGASTIKSRLLPWLGQGIGSYAGYYPDRALDLLAESVAKSKELVDLHDNYEQSLQTVETELIDTKADADELRIKLLDTEDDLQKLKRTSSSDKMFSETEINALRLQLQRAQDEVNTLRARSPLIDEYENQISKLQDEIFLLTSRRDRLITADIYVPPLSRSRPVSPFAEDDITQSVREEQLIRRWNDLYAQHRMNALNTLNIYSLDMENNQRIIFSVLQEAFIAAKRAFGDFKDKVRSNILVTHNGPETLEEAVQNYINRNSDIYDLPSLISQVQRALNCNYIIYLPPGTSYSCIHPFIREACKIAWSMSSLAFPLEIAISTDGELFNDNKYRRHFDSEFTAPLVNHYVWASLVQGVNVIVKGEAFTKRGASLTPSARRSRSPVRSRSTSPLRPYSSPSRLARNGRSPSPKKGPKYLP